MNISPELSGGLCALIAIGCLGFGTYLWRMLIDFIVVFMCWDIEREANAIFDEQTKEIQSSGELGTFRDGAHVVVKTGAEPLSDDFVSSHLSRKGKQ